MNNGEDRCDASDPFPFTVCETMGIAWAIDTWLGFSSLTYMSPIYRTVINGWPYCIERISISTGSLFVPTIRLHSRHHDWVAHEFQPCAVMPSEQELKEAIEWGRRMVMLAAQEYGPPVRWTDAEVEAHEERMRESMVFDNEFALTIDTRRCDYSFHHGVNRALGLKDDITMSEFLAHIHPDYFIMFQRWASAVYNTVRRFKGNMTPLGQSYRIMIPIRNANGQYLQLIQTSSMLQVDKDNNMLKYFSRYYVSHRAWEQAPLRPDIFDGRDPNDVWSHHMNTEIAKGISKNLFKAAEERILRLYHVLSIRKNGPEEPSGKWVQPKLEDVAVELDTNVENVRHYRKEIMRKSNLFLERNFERIEQVYLELRRLGFFDEHTGKAA